MSPRCLTKNYIKKLHQDRLIVRDKTQIPNRLIFDLSCTQECMNVFFLYIYEDFSSLAQGSPVHHKYKFNFLNTI